MAGLNLVCKKLNPDNLGIFLPHLATSIEKTPVFVRLGFSLSHDSCTVVTMSGGFC